MSQFLTDNIDQLDLALDQLAMKDRNFDRFALMLIDNVVELTLHEHATQKSWENEALFRWSQPRVDHMAVEAALGRHFGDKVKLAQSSGLVSTELAETIQYLHGFRNSAYHRGVRHDRVHHSLALLYFRTACALLAEFRPFLWGFSSRDHISHRAIKYLGSMDTLDQKGVFQEAWKRLAEVADSMGDSLAIDLGDDMIATIDGVESALDFLEENLPPKPKKKTRDEIVVECQVWHAIRTPEGKALAADKGVDVADVFKYMQWMLGNFPAPVRSDPVSAWRRRVESVRGERNPHIALKKYCEFMKQTEELREQLHDSAGELDAHIQELVDEARGK